MGDEGNEQGRLGFRWALGHFGGGGKRPGGLAGWIKRKEGKMMFLIYLQKRDRSKIFIWRAK